MVEGGEDEGGFSFHSDQVGATGDAAESDDIVRVLPVVIEIDVLLAGGRGKAVKAEDLSRDDDGICRDRSSRARMAFKYIRSQQQALKRSIVHLPILIVHEDHNPGKSAASEKTQSSAEQSRLRKNPIPPNCNLSERCRPTLIRVARNIS